MEFTLWNLNAPGFWGSSGNSCHSGETVTHVLCTSSSEEMRADGVSYSMSATPSPCEDSPYQSTAESEFIQAKSDSEMDKEHNCLVSLELETDLDASASALEPDLELKEDGDFSVSRTSRELKDDEEEEEEDDDDSATTDTGQVNDDGHLVPAVDNLWNNCIVGANVNVKTETPTYNLEDYAHPIFGRLPVKRLEPLSEDSDGEVHRDLNDEDEEDDDDDGEEEEEEAEEEEEVEEEEEEEDEGDGEVADNLSEEIQLSIVRSRSVPRVARRSLGYECGECDFMAETRPGLKKHISSVHPAPTSDANLAHALMRKLSQSTCCPLASCRFRSADPTEMERHVARHVAGGATIAPASSKKKASPVNLQRVRYEREEYRCQMCSYSCTIEKAFYKHLKLHSMGASVNSSSKISCVVCGKDRPTEVDMNKHMRKHRDNRYFCCDICVFRTVQLKKLIQHRRMHTGEKPHLCPHCPYRSARRDNLRSHVRRVHKKENLFCDTFSPRGLAFNTTTNN